MAEKKKVELSEDYIVLTIPKTAVEIEINAKVYYDGDVISVTKFMDMEEIREAFKEAADGYIPSDATFGLTEKGKQVAEAMGLCGT